MVNLVRTMSQNEQTHRVGMHAHCQKTSEQTGRGCTYMVTNQTITQAEELRIHIAAKRTNTHNFETPEHYIQIE